MLPPKRPSCVREPAAVARSEPSNGARPPMNQTYLAAVPAIGFVQVWFSPAHARFAEKMFGVVPFDPAVKTANTLSQKPEDASLRTLHHKAPWDVAGSASRMN